MRKWLFGYLAIFILNSFIFADVNKTGVSTSISEQNITSNIQNSEIKTKNIELIISQLKKLKEEREKDNIWLKIYSNYATYQKLKKRQEELLHKIFKLRHKRRLRAKERQELDNYIHERKTNASKLQLLSEFQDDPFKKLLEPPTIAKIPQIGNPLEIITAFSYLKKLKGDQQIYNENYKSLQQTLHILRQKRALLKQLLIFKSDNTKLKERIQRLDKEIKNFLPIYEIFKTTKNVYEKKLDEIKLNVKEEINREVRKTLTIVGIILFLFSLFIIFKQLLRKYMADKDSFYIVNKIANLLFVTITIIILLFAYIENVNYLVTILGFASAGIAIAMKDWFMSIMGWFVIVLGGSIHVGDRIKVIRNGAEYVGDVVDISLLRMTVQEDITLTTYMHNRRAGRIIFVPNNYIFTDLIANYSHAGLKTVWDGIDFNLTFDSDASKASSIAKEIVRKYSKGYTDITRKQLNKLRSSYHLKNTNVEPRIYTFVEPYGIRLSIWYLTNAFATLTLRSTISSEILAQLQKEESITLAYPTQSIYFQNVDSKVEPTKIPQQNEQETI